MLEEIYSRKVFLATQQVDKTFLVSPRFETIFSYFMRFNCLNKREGILKQIRKPRETVKLKY